MTLSNVMSTGISLVQIDSYDMTKTLGTYKITPDEGNYNYYLGRWADMNNDGLLDYVATKINRSNSNAGLVWYERA